MKTAKDKMEQALIELMKKKDIEKISIKELIAEADVNRSSYYYYYDSVIDVLDGIIQKFIEQFQVSLTFDESFSYGVENEEYIIQKMKPFTEYVLQNKETFVIIVESTMKYRLYDELIECGTKALKKNQMKYIVDDKSYKLPDKEEQYWNSQMLYAEIGILECWRKRKFEESVDELVHICYDVMYHKVINMS